MGRNISINHDRNNNDDERDSCGTLTWCISGFILNDNKNKKDSNIPVDGCYTRDGSHKQFRLVLSRVRTSYSS